MNSQKYNEYVLATVQQWFNKHLCPYAGGWIWMQDNASSHRSKLTQVNLCQRHLQYIRWPQYSPDLNLIEHVWSWMKDWIQEHYYIVFYDAACIPLSQLRPIILAA